MGTIKLVIPIWDLNPYLKTLSDVTALTEDEFLSSVILMLPLYDPEGNKVEFLKEYYFGELLGVEITQNKVIELTPIIDYYVEYFYRYFKPIIENESLPIYFNNVTVVLGVIPNTVVVEVSL